VWAAGRRRKAKVLTKRSGKMATMLCGYFGSSKFEGLKEKNNTGGKDGKDWKGKRGISPTGFSRQKSITKKKDLVIIL